MLADIGFRAGHGRSMTCSGSRGVFRERCCATRRGATYMRHALLPLLLALGACASDVAPLVPAVLPAQSVAGTSFRMGVRAVMDPAERVRTFVELPSDVLPVCIHVANDASASAVWLDAESLRLLGGGTALADAGIETPSMGGDFAMGAVAGLVPITAPALYWFIGQEHMDSGMASVQAMRYRLETQVLEPASVVMGCAYFRLPERTPRLDACVTLRPLADGEPKELCAGVAQ